VPVVPLADVRSVGVQGDGRTYGHRGVAPGVQQDAMTAGLTACRTMCSPDLTGSPTVPG
jgi:GMP synthase PP-ATPase subunit